MAQQIYVSKNFGDAPLGKIDIEVGLVTQHGTIAETNVGMFPGVVHLVSGNRGNKDGRYYTKDLYATSGSLQNYAWPTGANCLQFGMSNFDNPNRPSGFYIGNGTNSVPAASYR